MFVQNIYFEQICFFVRVVN